MTVMIKPSGVELAAVVEAIQGRSLRRSRFTGRSQRDFEKYQPIIHPVT